MNKRQGRLFAIVATACSVVVFLGMTIESHTEFDRLTHAENLTPQVVHGKNVWHKYNCINCHTLFGEGAYYAPDLTKIAEHRGAPYLKAYLHDPSRFYDEKRNRRLMPNEHLSDQEIDDLIAFLTWVSHIDNQGWPPRPILVTGASIPGTDLSAAQLDNKAQQGGSLPPGAPPALAAQDPVARGQALFRSVSPACAACHSVAPGVNMAGPSLAGVGTRAAQRVGQPDYKGAAKDAAAYLHESIVNPSAYVVPGAMYSSNGQSFMPASFGKDLTPQQIDDLVAYLMSLK
jgi:nitric oxide reductase subunit C